MAKQKKALIAEKNEGDLFGKSSIFNKVFPNIDEAEFYLDTTTSLFPKILKKSQKQSIATIALPKKNNIAIGRAVESSPNIKEKSKILVKPLPLQFQTIEIKTSKKENMISNEFVEFYDIFKYLKENGYQKIEIEIGTGKIKLININNNIL